MTTFNLTSVKILTLLSMIGAASAGACRRSPRSRADGKRD